jgi:hypothetical protein
VKSTVPVAALQVPPKFGPILHPHQLLRAFTTVPVPPFAPIESWRNKLLGEAVTVA